MQLGVVELTEASLHRATLVIEAGGLDDRPGVAQLVGRQLEEASPGVEIEVREHRITLSVSREDPEEALTTLAKVVARQRLPHATFNRVRDTAMEHAVAWSRDRPDEVTRELLTRVLLGGGASTSRAAVVATRSELSRIRRQHVDAFYRAHVHPERAWLLWVGPSAPASEEVDLAFATFLARGKSKLAPTAARATALSGPADTRVFVIETPQTDHARVVVVRHIPTLDAGGFDRLEVLEEVDAGPDFTRLGPGGFFWTEASLPNESVVNVTKAAVAALDSVAIADFAHAKKQRVTRAPLIAASSETLSSWLLHVTAHGLPGSYGQDYGRRMLALDGAATNAWLAEQAPTRVIVVWGDGDVLASGLRALGEVQIVDPRRGFAVRRTLSAL